MNKLAIFVEGQTEQIFVKQLLEEIAGAKKIRIETRKASGGRKGKRRLHLLQASRLDSGERFFVMIVDCGQDERVPSEIRDRYDGLVKAGYQAIIGIRDVYPEKREAIPKLRQYLPYRIRTDPVEVLFVLAVMEIEAWFIAEHTHFRRISEMLTMERIRAANGFDPSTDDVTLRDHPAADLDNIYRLTGYRYRKSKTHVERTVNVLDYAKVYLELGERLNDLQQLVDHIDVFLSERQET